MTSLIVGCGPVGAYLGSKLKNSTIIDQKKTIGNPVRCTGILTTEIEQLATKKDIQRFTLNKIYGTRVVGPHSQVDLALSTNYIICNTTFENTLADNAVKNGTEILLNHKYMRSKESKHQVKDMNTAVQRTIEAEQLIGCDGPNSVVGQQNQLNTKKTNNYLGLQVSLKVKNHENIIQFFPHIGQYGWYVPESDTVARVGICASKTPKPLLDAFLKRFNGKVIATQAGFIPYHKPFYNTCKQTAFGKAVLLGDAGLHIKNTTGGGIIPGIKAAKHFAKHHSSYNGTSSKVQRELYMHYLVHNVLKHCTVKEWDQIIDSVSVNKESIEQVNRDKLWTLAPQLLKNHKLFSIGAKKVLSGKAELI